jgi:5-aminopentanamidase
VDQTLHIAVVQSPGHLGEPAERLNWLDACLAGHGASRFDLVALPELFVTGYNVGSRLRERAEPPDGPSACRIADLARKYDFAIHYGYIELSGDGLYNSAQTFGPDGNPIGKHRKLAIPPGFEVEHFIGGAGCTLFELKGFRIATLICYDAEFPETFRHVCETGADLVVVPTALSDQWDVVARRLIPTRAFENGVYVAYANHCGEEGDIRYLGESCIVGPDGRDMARAGADEEVISARLVKDRVTAARTRLPYHIDRRRIRLDA